MTWLRGMQHRMRKKGAHCGKGWPKRGMHLGLDVALENEQYMILSNPDIKTTEMGLHAGALVKIIKNHDNDSNIIIAIGDSRYIVPRDLAKLILVK